jgi:hypothetical protein
MVNHNRALFQKQLGEGYGATQRGEGCLKGGGGGGHYALC